MSRLLMNITYFQDYKKSMSFKKKTKKSVPGEYVLLAYKPISSKLFHPSIFEIAVRKKNFQDNEHFPPWKPLYYFIWLKKTIWNNYYVVSSNYLICNGKCPENQDIFRSYTRLSICCFQGFCILTNGLKTQRNLSFEIVGDLCVI